MIYFDAVLCLLPSQLGGANIGVVLALIAPETILLSLALATLAFAWYKTFMKARYVYSVESIAKTTMNNESTLSNPLIAPVNNTDETLFPLITNCSVTINQEDVEDIKNNKFTSTRTRSHSDDTLPKMILPYRILFVLAAAWFTYAIINVSMYVATKKCSPGYFVLLVIVYPPLLVAVVWAVKYIAKVQLENPTTVLTGDLDFAKISYIPAILAFIVGIICSLLGIGGGEVT